MTEKRQCPQCGEELPPDAPMGLCPGCVLKLGVGSVQGSQTGPTMPQNTPTGPQGSPAGAAFVPPAPEELAALLPQLEVLELLGQGGMGAVYKARQSGLDRLVALKVLPPSFGADPAFAERFTREARSLARLNHPNIVGVYDFGQAGGFYYFVMEYVDGVNLRQMERRQPLAPKEALAIVPQICDALQFAHDEGIVHRDIKPENILIDTKGRVKIADFGLAKLLGRTPADVTLTQTRQVMGTVHYMAPEQVEHPAAVDQRADIYSLGVVFYEMLTGELPLGRFAPPSQKVQMDVRLDEVVLKTLEKEPQRRYQQASQVRTDVEQIARVPAAALPPSQLKPPLGADATFAHSLKWKFVSGLIWAAFVFVLLAVVTGFAAATFSGFGSPMSNGSFAANLAPLLVILPAGVMIIASGGVDLSVGAVAGLASALFAFLLREEVPPAAAISLALLCGLSVGLLNGLLVAFLRVHPAIVTLGTMVGARALAGLVSGGVSFYLPAGFWEGLDSPAVWYTVVAASIVLGAVLVHLTPLCSRADAARRSGALGGPAAGRGSRTGRAVSVMALYTLSGTLAATCGFLVIVRLHSYDPTMWFWWELPLEVIAAAVIGGTVFRSGFGNFGGAVLAVLLLRVTALLMRFEGASEYAIRLTEGLGLVVLGGLSAGYYLLVKWLYRRSRTANVGQTAAPVPLAESPEPQGICPPPSRPD